ncbi:MAG TPA: MFS transporter [Limnochordia bacterium]|nr:MFS transporter [Limnochordia bacterium]
MAAVALATMLAPLNSTMIAVALPPIMRQYGVGVAETSWLVTGYLIAMASLQPVAGKLGDRFGRRPLILGGLVYFALASLGAALAPNFALLLCFRLQQGLAGAVALPNGTALLREVIPAERRGRRFGLVGSGTALAAASGPPLAGVLVGFIGWQALFGLNVLVIGPALWLAWRTFPRTGVKAAVSRFDLAGATLLSVTLIGLAGLLAGVGSGAWRTLGWVAVAMAAFGWAAVEWRHSDPVVQLRLFARRSYAAATAAVALSNFAMYVSLLVVPLLLAGQAGGSVLTGLVLTAMSGAMFAGAPLGGWLADRWGRRRPPLLGFGVLTAGAVTLALAGGGIHLPVLIGALFLIGLGVGTASAGLQTSAVESVAGRDAGMAAGVYSTCRYIGSIVGSAILAHALGGPHPTTGAFGLVFTAIAACAALSWCAALGLEARPAERAASS